MRAVAKIKAAPGVDIVDLSEPDIRPGCVRIKVEQGSVCGTDLHIFSWDEWSRSRITPPRVIGHEFCGTVVELGPGVGHLAVGDFVASESHIVCGRCKQCVYGQGHVCANTQILGVDVDGGFSEYAVVPAENARRVDPRVPREVASMLDAVGNGVHAALAGPLEGRAVLITGMGPIGLFSLAVCRAMQADRVVVTEVSQTRIGLAERMGADVVVNPREEDADALFSKLAPGGFDVVLEMSGHPHSLELAVRHTRPGGRISLLGVYAEAIQRVDMNQLIFKGIDLQGIVGRRLWDTWDQMMALLLDKGMDVSPVITHRAHFTEIAAMMEEMRQGRAGKVVFRFDG